MTLRTLSYSVLQDYHQQKRHDPQTPALDLRECDLTGFDLRALDLSGANLEKADLTGTLLGNTNLRGTILHKTRFADISLGALLATGLDPVALLQQHRAATYYLLRLFHFAPVPEQVHMFPLSQEECVRICQVYANLLWQQLDDQAVISALYPDRIWEDWLLGTTIRPVLDWIMTHSEHLPTLRKIIAWHNNYLAGVLRNARQTQDVEQLLAQTQHIVTMWERDEEKRQQRDAEEAMWLAAPVAYPLALWPDGPQVTQIKSRQELVAILKRGTYYQISQYEVSQFEYNCLDESCFLYHVGGPGAKGLLVTMLPDGSVREMTDRYLMVDPADNEPVVKIFSDGSADEVAEQELDLAPLAAWLNAWGSAQTDLSPLGRACYLLSKVGIAKLIYQIYWYNDDDQVDVQSCLDEQGNELAPSNPAISRAHWILHYEKPASEYYGHYELSVPEKRLVRLGDAQIPEEDATDELFEGEI